MKSDGTLLGLNNAQVQNHSSFPLHVSLLDIDPVNGWSFVSNGESGDAPNELDLQIGTGIMSLDAYDYLSKTAIPSNVAWNMAARGSTNSLLTSAQLANRKILRNKNLKAPKLFSNIC